MQAFSDCLCRGFLTLIYCDLLTNSWFPNYWHVLKLATIRYMLVHDRHTSCDANLNHHVMIFFRTSIALESFSYCSKSKQMMVTMVWLSRPKSLYWQNKQQLDWCKITSDRVWSARWRCSWALFGNVWSNKSDANVEDSDFTVQLLLFFSLESLEGGAPVEQDTIDCEY